MHYRVEHALPNKDVEVLQYGAISREAAQARARRLSEKVGELGHGVGGHSVYLFGYDEEGDQEYFCFFGGGLAEKDLVKDWA